MKMIIVVAASIGFFGALSAAEHTIGQKGKKFSVTELKIAKGDDVSFVNDDDTVHNVMIKHEKKSFNKAQQPGDKHSEKFGDAGSYDVRCAIHPNMRAKIIVE
jgi:plastocyanin